MILNVTFRNIIKIATFISFITFLIKYLWKRRQTIYLSLTIPGPAFPLPFIGNAWLLRNQMNAVEVMKWMAETFGSPTRFWLGTQLLMIYSQPDQLEIILNSSDTIDKGKSYHVIRNIIGGEGLFTSGGDEWKTHRKLLNPTIQHFSILNSFYPIFNEHMQTLVNKVGEYVGKGEFNCYIPLEACSLDMICETTLGTKMNIQQKQNLHFLDSVNNLLNVVSLLIYSPWYKFKPLFRLTKYAKTFDNDVINVRTFAKDIVLKKIDEYKQNLNSNKTESNNTTLNTIPESSFSKCKRNFVDECMKLLIVDKVFTVDEVLNESLTMLSGGFETTALTSSYIILMLALNPEYQEKVYDEIHTIFPDQLSLPTSDDLAKLDYTNRFIKETMRVTPTVPYTTRYVKNDIKIGNDIVPAGTELILGFFDVYRNQWGPDYAKFNPDNFLPENLKDKHQYSFLPYSGGIRNCIGFRYGHIVIRLFVIWLIRQYRFSTNLKLEDLKFHMSITLKLQNKHMIQVHRRTNY